MSLSNPIIIVFSIVAILSLAVVLIIVFLRVKKNSKKISPAIQIKNSIRENGVLMFTESANVEKVLAQGITPSDSTAGTSYFYYCNGDINNSIANGWISAASAHPEYDACIYITNLSDETIDNISLKNDQIIYKHKKSAVTNTFEPLIASFSVYYIKDIISNK